MKTIGAKELRQHLDQVFDRVIGGEDVVVSHRFKGPVRLTSVCAPSSYKHSKLEGLRAFDAAAKNASPYDPRKSIKALYDVSISKKYLG